MPTIATTSQKGGVGKTSVTAEIAATLASRGRRVLIVDLDPQGNQTQLYDVAQDETTVGTAQLLDPTRPISLASAITTDVALNVDLIAAVPGELELTKNRLQAESLGRESYLRKALAGADQVYDWILIDCPPETGLMVINGIVAADGVITITLDSLFAVKGAATMQALVERCAAAAAVSPVFLGVVRNQVKEASVMAKLIASDLEIGPLPVLESGIHHREVVPQAQYAGKFVRDYAPRADIVTDFDDLTDEIVKLIAPERTDSLSDKALSVAGAGA